MKILCNKKEFANLILECRSRYYTESEDGRCALSKPIWTDGQFSKVYYACPLYYILECYDKADIHRIKVIDED